MVDVLLYTSGLIYRDEHKGPCEIVCTNRDFSSTSYDQGGSLAKGHGEVHRLCSNF